MLAKHLVMAVVMRADGEVFSSTQKPDVTRSTSADGNIFACHTACVRVYLRVDTFYGHSITAVRHLNAERWLRFKCVRVCLCTFVGGGGGTLLG